LHLLALVAPAPPRERVHPASAAAVPLVFRDRHEIGGWTISSETNFFETKTNTLKNQANE
jgi:hypothetical protein